MTLPSPRRVLRALAAIATLLAPGAFAADAPFGLVAHGHFKRMVHTGDTTGQVPLAALQQGAGRWGIGALAGLRGEIVQAHGRLLVSRGQDAQGRTEAPRDGDQAVLFAGATVRGWADLTVPRDMDAAAFEAFVVEQARARGIDVQQAFPFLVDGRYPQLVWHVVTGEAPAGPGAGPGGGHGGHANKRAGMRVFDEGDARGRLVAMYSGAALEGVVSHPGERLHLHYIDLAQARSGHVDRFAVAAGSLLRLPR
jgi:Alpha-acetolactate decarboxylase